MEKFNKSKNEFDQFRWLQNSKLAKLNDMYYFITVPDSHPYYRGYDVLQDGCLRVAWEPISDYDRNGQILYYTITYVATCFEGQDDGHEGNVTVSGSNNNVTLCNLRPGLQYRLGLSGSTSKGMGPTSHHDDVYAGKNSVIFTPPFLFKHKMFCKIMFYRLRLFR